MRRRRMVTLVMITTVIAIAGCTSSSKASSSPATTTIPGGSASSAVTSANDHPGLCGATTGAPARYDHVVWIVFENADYGDIIGKSTMPYVNRLAAKCGSATQMFAEQHPSAPNYIAMVSGSTQGQNDDANPAFQYSAANLFYQVKAQGKPWRNYAESMPSNCRTSDYTAPGESGPIFTAHHEPAPYFKLNQAACAKWMVPMGNGVTTGALVSDVQHHTLPTFAFIGPNDDGGTGCGDVDAPCSGGVGNLETFLKRVIPTLTATSEYHSGRMAIFLTWDEGNFSANDQHIPTIVIAPSVPTGIRPATSFTHYSMLKTTEQMLGITTFLGHAATATSMNSAFHLLHAG